MSNVRSLRMSARFEVNVRKIVLAFGLPIGVLLAYGSYSFVSAWLRLGSIQDHSMRVAQARTLYQMAFIAVVCLVGVGIAIGLLFRNVSRTELGETEIIKQGIFGRTHIKWSEITTVKHLKNGSIKVVGPTGSVLIPVKYYREPEATLAFVNLKTSRLSADGH